MTKDEANFIAFAKDHFEHFDALPCEFETLDGTVWDIHKCWKIAEKYQLVKELERSLKPHV